MVQRYETLSRRTIRLSPNSYEESVVKAELTEASEAISPIASRRSHPAQFGKGFDAPPSLERSGSEHREGAVTSLALLERARAWEWVKDPPAGEGQVGQI